jgi:hypothetical protein
MQPPRLSAGRDHANGDRLSDDCGLPAQTRVSPFDKPFQKIHNAGENGSHRENW